ncbi:MAG: histidine kinase dimerization/phospho-acceptor domain-containing protein [Halobacteria archaeon]
MSENAEEDLEDSTSLHDVPICRGVYCRDKAFAIDDVSTDAPDLYRSEWLVSTYLGAPVKIKGEKYGTFCFYDTEPNREGFADWEKTFVELICDWVGTGLTRRSNRQELERQNKRLEEFAGIVSHDLRNPLGVVSNGLELIREECDTPYIEDVDHALGRMQGLIEDLLDMARQGESVDELRWHNLPELLENCWRNVETGDSSLNVEEGVMVSFGRCGIWFFQDFFRPFWVDATGILGYKERNSCVSVFQFLLTWVSIIS